MFFACSSADAMSSTGPPLHGATGTFVASARYLACTLSPSLRIAAFGRGMQRYHLDAVPELRVQLPDRTNQPDRGLAAVDHRNTRKHSGCSSIYVGGSVLLGCRPATG